MIRINTPKPTVEPSYYWINAHAFNQGVELSKTCAYSGRRFVTDLDCVLNSDNDELSIEITLDVATKLTESTHPIAVRIVKELANAAILANSSDGAVVIENIAD